MFSQISACYDSTIRKRLNQYYVLWLHDIKAEMVSYNAQNHIKQKLKTAHQHKHLSTVVEG